MDSDRSQGPLHFEGLCGKSLLISYSPSQTSAHRAHPSSSHTWDVLNTNGISERDRGSLGKISKVILRHHDVAL